MAQIGENQVSTVLTSPVRAVRHLAVWLVWQAAGISLMPESTEAEAAELVRFEAA